MIDIHNTEVKLQRVLNRIEEENISKRNKDIIKEYDNFCVFEKMSKKRRIKIIPTLINFAKLDIKKDFDKATIEDIKKAILKLENSELKAWTKQGYKSIIKRFYKWIDYKDNFNSVPKTQFPDKVAWIKTNIKKKEKPRLKASDILSVEEIRKLIFVAKNPRDKAFISLLYELGCRVGEIGSVIIGDITKQEHGYLIDLKGKTGHRTPIVSLSDSYLTNWLNQHPDKNNNKAPLWVMLTDNRAMTYASLKALIKRLSEKAEIKKRIYPHLFRHSRVTHLLSSGAINEAQAKVYFGWEQDSDVLGSTYSHLVDKDVNRAILEANGIVEKEEKDQLKNKVCLRCGYSNPEEYVSCGKCSFPLDTSTAMKLIEEQKMKDIIVSAILEATQSKDMQEFNRQIIAKVKESGIEDKLLND